MGGLGTRAIKGDPVVSVVIPAYQAEATLGAALACVRAQTYPNWTCTVVDNHSTDGTLALASQAAEADPRISVVSLAENRGPAGGRNAGIEHAHGEYLWMADADDTFRPDLLQRALVAAQSVEGGADAVVFGYVERYFDSRGRHLYDHRLVPGCPGPYARPDEWHRLVPRLEQGTFYGYPWNKLWSMSHLRESGTRFEDVRLIEDVTFSAAFFQDAGSLVVLDDAPYLYAKVEGKSVTNANDYTAEEYWSLHERRIALLMDQQRSWGSLDDEGRAVLGSLYARFVVSALERTYHKGEDWDRARRLAWCQGVFRTGLCQELAPHARAESSRSLAVAIRALSRRDARALVAMGHAAHLARQRTYGLFTAIRSER